MKKDIWILTALGVIVLHSPVRAKGVVDDTSDQTAPAIAAPSAASSPRQSVSRPVPDNADHPHLTPPPSRGRMEEGGGVSFLAGL